MKNIRIVICNNNYEEAEFYENFCRDLGSKNNVSLGIKVYDSTNSLLFDLDNPEFRERLDVIFFTFTEENLEAPHAIRDTGYSGLIVLMGGAEMIAPYEQLFDTETYNFVQTDRSRQNLERFSKIFQSAAKVVAKTHAEKLALSYGGEIRQIDIDDIHYFEVQTHTLIVHYGRGETFSFISSLSKMENHLKGREFMRVSRFYLVSLNAVQKVSSNNIVMRDGANIPIGRKYYAKLKDRMNEKAVMVW